MQGVSDFVFGMSLSSNCLLCMEIGVVNNEKILFYSPFDNLCYCFFQTHKLWQGSLSAGLGLHFEIIPFPSILDMFVSYNVVNITMLFQMQCGK